MLHIQILAIHFRSCLWTKSKRTFSAVEGQLGEHRQATIQYVHMDGRATKEKLKKGKHEMKEIYDKKT